MVRDIYKISGLLTLLALVALGTASSARGADGMAERYRMQRYYECCYGPSYYGPNGYVRRMNWGRSGNCCERDCDPKAGHHCCLGHCCLGHCLVPGSEPPSKCLDICLYHIVFPMSPWYSNPRDGICYPAFGTKSPTCVPQND
jgi:hypothetical protein